MKKKVLSAAVLLATTAGSAQAINLSQTGMGEAFVSPFYTVRGGNTTLLSITNTTDEYKALKIRFREARNSREVLDFNIYLSPHDVWTAAVRDNGDGGAEIVSNDESCVAPRQLPRINAPIGSGELFRTAGFDGTLSNWPYDGGGKGSERTREGYFELFEMASLPNRSDAWDYGKGEAAATQDGINDALHDDNGKPNSCPGIHRAWADDRFNRDDDQQPTGGIFVNSMVIHPASGIAIDVPVTAFEAYADIPVHAAPGSIDPSFADTQPEQSVVHLNTHWDQQAVTYWDLWTQPEDAVTALLQTWQISNEFTLNPLTNGQTTWVVTLPVKHHYTDDLRGLATAQLFNDHTYLKPPFSQEFQYYRGQSCESYTLLQYNREEFTKNTADFSPSGSEKGSLCYETNVVNFANRLLSDGEIESNLFGSDELPVQVGGQSIGAHSTVALTDARFKSGWVGFQFTEAHQHLLNDSGTRAYIGLPAIGFRASNVANGSLVVDGEQMLANYAFSSEHVYNKNVLNPDDAERLDGRRDDHEEVKNAKNQGPVLPNGFCQYGAATAAEGSTDCSSSL